MFNENERLILRKTTFRDIIVRNLEIDGDDNSQFIRNIWMIEPQTELNSEKDNDYKSISHWTDYFIGYRLDNTRIHFKVELQTAGGEGWFGMVSSIIVSSINFELSGYYVYIFFN